MAEGEGTGHRHELDKGQLTRLGLHLMVSVPDGAVLSHPEHAALILPAGEYRVTRQREYTPGRARGMWD